MPALIETLIEAEDVAEIVLAQIAAVLAIEVAGQKVLAVDAVPPKDPTQWDLRVFLERVNPWAEFSDDPEQVDATPVVSVSRSSQTYEQQASSVVDGHKTVCLYNVDCFGYGKSADVEGGGHVPGDEKAAFEAQRAVRLVRNILMSGHYTYLGLRKTVWRRWLQSVTFTDRPLTERASEHVVAARMVFAIEFSERSPQWQGVPMDRLILRCTRAGTGQIYFTAEYGADS